MTFDPTARSSRRHLRASSFGARARFVILPVPFDATTSLSFRHRNGPRRFTRRAFRSTFTISTSAAPANAHRHAAEQGRGEAHCTLNAEARRFAEPVIAAAGRVRGKPRLQRAVSEASRRCGRDVRHRGRQGARVDRRAHDPGGPPGPTRRRSARSKPARQHPPGLGICTSTPHADLRVAYEGFEWSHASIMHNVALKIGAAGGVVRLVQVGIRDFGEDELRLIEQRTRRATPESSPIRPATTAAPLPRRVVA